MSTYRLGLTGSIGMGKSTTSAMFAAEGVPIWDADAVVHRLYAAGGAAVAPIAAICPEAVVSDAVSRPHLRACMAADPGLLDKVQAIIHPLVAQDRATFVATATAPIILLDVPLLFEIGAERDCDGVVVVSAPSDAQRQRVLGRGTMTQAELDLILSRQMPDAEKRARATWVIETTDLDSARAAVRQILSTIRSKAANA